ncbi:hypothetical protein LSH36_13g10022 [Paralvinella palmiformis]|uniref:RCC1-like domain-containing protein n=1 Tax=Paralvinella palmiformis TaxID=53620 RepID=A0AAD9KCZ0_9ANNE|nr:hypothetical protein LSH36_13g10022 [Paralvinella palmiformis]
MSKKSNTSNMAKGKKRLRAADVKNDKDEINKQPPGKKLKPSKVCHDSICTMGGCVLTLGQGDTGQLGLGPDVMERTKPGKVDIDAPVVQISAGGMHTVCLTDKGEVFTFGCDDEGALGRDASDEDEMFSPGKVNLDHKIIQVSAGDSHTAALTDSGHVYAWGTFRDSNGSIGLLPDGSKAKRPTVFMTHPRVLKICSGTDHLVCLTEDGGVYTAGCADQGQLGRIAECFSQRGGRKGLTHLLTPMRIYCRKRNLRFSDVWTGQYHTFARSTNGNIYAWGLNNYYQLGFSDMLNRFMPEISSSFDSNKGWKEISGGQHHTLALDKDGCVYSLGRKEYGRLGLGKENLEEKSAPTLVPRLKDEKCVHVDCATAVSFAVTDKGAAYAWGMGTSSQLGQTDEDDLYEPTPIAGKQLENRSVLLVSAGGQHTVILAKDNS